MMGLVSSVFDHLDDDSIIMGIPNDGGVYTIRFDDSPLLPFKFLIFQMMEVNT